MPSRTTHLEIDRTSVVGSGHIGPDFALYFAKALQDGRARHA
ncbi:MAG TPA: hypothetical protein VIK50_04940 [Gemmatimonadaceae bacterium]